MKQRTKAETKGGTDLMSLLAAQLSDSAKKPNNLMFQPHPKQLPFHNAQKTQRLFLGGNRAGKTVSGINEDIWWLTGTHPYIKTPEPPVAGRLVTVDFKNGLKKIILPVLQQWIPPSALCNGSWSDSWNGSDYVLTLENGSQLEIMSHEQELDKFAGVPRHFIHFDEECPKDIFQECKARLVDYGGSWWITMTPVEGITWIYEDLYEPYTLGKAGGLHVTEVNSWDNPHLTEGGIAELLEGLDEEQTQIRGQGKFVAIGGLVFKHYSDEHNIESRVPPSTWQHWVSLDAGYNNPTAVLWHAVSPEGVVVTYDEHYRSEWTVEQHAEEITRRNEALRDNYGIVPYLHVADPAIKQRQQITGLSIQIEYSQRGLNFATPASRDVGAGLDKMNNYLRLNKWFITDSCPNLRREMRMYKRASYSSSKVAQKNNKQEKPQKKNDHACDSARYFFSFQPDLDWKAESKKPLLTGEQVASLIGGVATTFNPRRPARIDPNVLSQSSSKTHFVQDEFVGEY